MPSTPTAGDDVDTFSESERGDDDRDASSDPESERDKQPYVTHDTVSDLVTAVKFVVGGVVLFVAALFGGALGGGGEQVVVFLFVVGAALLALGYWSLPDV